MKGTGAGELLVVEGANRVGKTTLVRAIVDRLERGGVRVEAQAFPGRTPSTIGRLVHRLHKDPSETGVAQISATALQVLHIAAHLDAIERIILPLIDAGVHVVLDRYWWSTVAYCSAAGVPEDFLGKLVELESVAWRGLRPVLAVVIERSVREDGAKAALRATLRRRYDALVVDARSDYPAEHIWNDGSIEEAIANLECRLLANGASMIVGIDGAGDSS